MGRETRTIMKKIPCLFVRIFDDKHKFTITPEVTPGCEWVLAGEGRATRKFDGTACMVHAGQLCRRYDVRKGKPTPQEWEPCQPKPDPVTGHWPGWLLVRDEPESKYHREAFKTLIGRGFPCDGTYELIGPKVQGNPEAYLSHELIPHGEFVLAIMASDLSFERLREYLDQCPYEGIVWHHPDGRMAKLRRDDFGFAWPVKS